MKQINHNHEEDSINFIVAVISQSIKAQKTIVGTPNTTKGKTGSDHGSTTKGLLIPSMTTVQRNAITPAPDGLLVFDTDFNELYYRGGNTWRKILNSTFWSSSSTRKWIYNTSDSIGIGTSKPDARLEVVGNVKTSGRIDAGGVVEAAGLSSTGTLYINKTSLLDGAVTAHSNLSVGGNITANGKVTTLATGDNNSMIPLCYGVVNDQGELKRGTANVTVTKVAAAGFLGDHYRISCPGITSNSIIIATPEFLSTSDISARCVSGAAEVYTYFKPPNKDLDFRYLGFSFVIYK